VQLTIDDIPAALPSAMLPTFSTALVAPKSPALVRAVLDRVDRELTRHELSLAFPDSADVFDRSIDSHIYNFRRKLNATSDCDPIRSVCGTGYAFDD
jgi:DNA-binding response OmpR family regulator